MDLQKQVCTLEQAKQLKDLGVTQESNFLYYEYEVDGKLIARFNYMPSSRNLKNYYSAFSVAELGVMLPEYVGDYFLEMYKDCSNTESKEWFLVRYVENDGIGGTIINYGFNKPYEAEARCDMLIYLLENNLITVEECNKRLQLS